MQAFCVLFMLFTLVTGHYIGTDAFKQIDVERATRRACIHLVKFVSGLVLFAFFLYVFARIFAHDPIFNIISPGFID